MTLVRIWRTDDTVAAIAAAGFLVGEPTLEVLELHGGFLDAPLS